MSTPDQYLHLDAQFVKAEIAKLVEAHPELAEDEALRLDTIEGETNAYRIIERAVVQALDAEAMAEGLGLRMKDMSTRAGRFFAKSEAMRSLAKSIMKAASIRNLTLPEATLTITKARETVGIINIDELPQGFFRTIRQADKAAIKDALAGGQDVPGAALVIGAEGLSIRTK